MANPQKENGFTPIANELVEHLVSVKMSGTEWQYVMCIFRKTYGWNKKEDWVTNSQIVQMTGLKKERVSEAKSRLLARNIVTENRNKISIQKDWEKWKELRKSVTIVTEKRNSELRKSVTASYGKAYTQKKLLQKKKEAINRSLKKNMSWKKPYNENTHSDDLPEIDAELNEEIKPPEKTKRHYREIYALFAEILNKPTPANWLVNTTQQKCADNLYTERGLVPVKNALLFYQDHKDLEFCPKISSPSDLDAKWTKLAEFKRKHNDR